ncbi:MAG: hypothetical protein ACM3ZF_07720 [Mycobacterium leprae]
MSQVRGRWLPLVVLVAATAALLASIVWVTAGVFAPGTPPPAGPRRGWMPMMYGPGGGVSLTPGAGPVRDIVGARTAAQQAADQLGLRVGEVMQFSNNYYAELLTSAGRGATEVLVDPGSGAVQVEYGPAMMWNTAYGMGAMMRPRDWFGTSAPSVSPDQARRIADRWLQRQRTSLRAGDPESFPGYYTLHTLRGDKIVGMLSVNARSGAVWYHSWHGQFLHMQEPPGTPNQTR